MSHLPTTYSGEVFGEMRGGVCVLLDRVTIVVSAFCPGF